MPISSPGGTACPRTVDTPRRTVKASSVAPTGASFLLDVIPQQDKDAANMVLQGAARATAAVLQGMRSQ